MVMAKTRNFESNNNSEPNEEDLKPKLKYRIALVLVLIATTILVSNIQNNVFTSSKIVNLFNNGTQIV